MSNTIIQICSFVKRVSKKSLTGIEWKGISSAALLLFARSARERYILLESARDLRGPGLRAYFCRAAKVGKNALEPTVQDSLDGQARARLCPIRGLKDCAAGLLGRRSLRISDPTGI